MIKKIAIQGVKGSFHDIAAKKYFGTAIAIEECQTFDYSIELLLNAKVDAVLMALENSIAGSILPNYMLINAKGLTIIGECYLDIQHNLMALPNQKIELINEVYSHPMALLQCKEFFKKHLHIKLIEDKDTAEVAKRIQENKLKNIGAIASREAASLYQLEILAPSIQTINYNETRFVIVSTTNTNIHFNKASLIFELEHQRGSLAAVLNALSDCKLNLTKIQSLPKIKTPWKYVFFVDVNFEEEKHFNKAISVLNIMAKNVRVLGTYKNAKK